MVLSSQQGDAYARKRSSLEAFLELQVGDDDIFQEMNVVDLAGILASEETTFRTQEEISAANAYRQRTSK